MLADGIGMSVGLMPRTDGMQVAVAGPPRP